MQKSAPLTCGNALGGAVEEFRWQLVRSYGKQPTISSYTAEPTFEYGTIVWARVRILFLNQIWA